MVQCPAASLYLVARKPSHPLMNSIPFGEIVSALGASEAWEKSLNNLRVLVGNTVVAREEEMLSENVRSSELMVTLRWPWMTGALSLTKSIFSKSICEANIAAPGIGSPLMRARAASFIILMVFRYAPVTAFSNVCPSFQLLQKKNVVGSGR